MLKMAIPVCSFCVLLSAAQAEPFTLNVMSFNIRYGTANDGENAWPHRRDIVVNMLRELSPDIIGTQECLDFQADYIVEQLPQYRWFGVGREADCSGERMAILYKWKQFSPIEVSNFWLSETPDVPGSQSWESACARMVTAARFYHNRTRQSFMFYNTHFDHRSEPARQNAAAILRERAAAVDASMPVIILGDFNAKGGDSETWNILVQDGIQDAWLVADETVGPPVTFSRFEPPQMDVDRRIDWILVRGPIAVEQCETVLYNEDGRYVSDHFPVSARLRLTP